MSLISANLAFMTKTGQFINAKLENAKSVKDDMTDQQQNSDDITGLFDVFRVQVSFNEASLNEASLSKTFKLSTFYQCLDCSHINIQM